MEVLQEREGPQVLGGRKASVEILARGDQKASREGRVKPGRMALPAYQVLLDHQVPRVHQNFLILMKQ